MLLAPWAAASETAETTESLLGSRYPLDACISYPGALLHWLDSLAGLTGPGTTGGKTISAHRDEFRQRFGDVGATDRVELTTYARVRSGFAASAGPEDIDDLTLAFFDARTLDEALDASARLLLDPELGRLFSASVRRFADRYGRIWDGGRVPRTFLDSVVTDRSVGREIAKFLSQVARFYGAKTGKVRPRLIPVPVPPGAGTHAQAVGRSLLIEVRAGETLVDEVSPIVHENAHFLFHAMPDDSRAALEAQARALGREGQDIWERLQEALPTAIAQGVAGERFLGDRWPERGAWYHLDDVDLCAKAIFPEVKHALDRGAGIRDVWKDLLATARNAAPLAP